jgi:23S rRNA (adenine2503-C2)-methyltransferase
MIRKMGDDQVRAHFALSLHAATDLKRNQIIPVNKRYPLKEISAALKYYHTKTGKRFTIEYILFRNFNDSLADAADLAVFCKSFPVKVNLLDYNPVEGSVYQQTEPQKMNDFRDYLLKKNMVVNIRKSRGKDIAGACGQLALSRKTGAEQNVKG